MQAAESSPVITPTSAATIADGEGRAVRSQTDAPVKPVPVALRLLARELGRKAALAAWRAAEAAHLPAIDGP